MWTAGTMTGINKIICEKSKLCILGLVRRLYILGLVCIEILLSIFNVSFSSEVLEEITFIETSFETTLEMSKNFKSSSVRFFEPRIHVERTGSVLLAQICAMTLATFICLPFLPLRISCHNRGSGFCSIRYLIPFTKNDDELNEIEASKDSGNNLNPEEQPLDENANNQAIVKDYVF